MLLVLFAAVCRRDSRSVARGGLCVALVLTLSTTDDEWAMTKEG